MKASARINMLRQLGSLSKSPISHTAEQPFCVGSKEGICHTSWKCLLPRTTNFFYAHCTNEHSQAQNWTDLSTGQTEIWI